ncbi:hypothetical protein L7F22_021026 [Adiantum nelumboides]|nr:hypothetical protein [Adiantum nelumboides]
MQYAIARLLKDVTIAPPILDLDESSSHSDKKDTPFKEKTRCESAQESFPSCTNQNRLEKSEVSASKLEDLHSDDTGPNVTWETRTIRFPTWGLISKNEEQSGLKVQGPEMDERHDSMKAGTNKGEEELASNMFLASLTAEIVSFFENEVSQPGLEQCTEHHDTHS